MSIKKVFFSFEPGEVTGDRKDKNKTNTQWRKELETIIIGRDYGEWWANGEWWARYFDKIQANTEVKEVRNRKLWWEQGRMSGKEKVFSSL